MNEPERQIMSLLGEAVEHGSPEERAAFLDKACAGDAGRRARVEKLLRAYQAAGNFLQGNPPSSDAIATIDEPPVTERPGTVIGPYKLLEQIGEGGFGVVFMAEQTHPVRRKVALKVLKPGMDTRQVVARIEAERQALALMDHPNIARVFDGGETVTGRPYFVMELVRGIPITEFCDQNHLGVRQRLELFLSMCQAVQHAHQKGIIHRDLKPTNVLVTLHDNRPVVKVIDFGIAKATGQQLTDKTLFTNFAQMIGTPLYMSPEQAQMTGLDIDTRTDIYALGVLLYELLTGTTPLDGERLRTAGYDEIRRAIREEEPPRPSTRISTLGQAAATVSANRRSDPKKLSQFMRGELDWIVMKALEKDRNRRYESASAFAADVQRYLNDEAVLACPPTAMYRFRKFARRNKRAVAMASVVGLAVLLAVAVLATSTFLIANALQGETRAKDDLQEALKLARRDGYFHRITLAHRDLSSDNLGRALKLLEECPEDLREWEWHYLMRLCKVEPLVLGDKTEVNGVAFSPDGERLASAGGDGTIKIWNSRTGDLVRTFNAHTDSVVSLAFHPDGKHLASRGADLTVKVWDLTATGQAVWTEPCDATRKFGSAYTIAFSPDGQQVAAATDGVVKVWDWKNRQLLRSLPGGDFHTISVAFSGDGRLATGGFREGLKLWDPDTGTLLRAVPAHDSAISALAFSADGKWLASAGYDRTVKLSDSTTGRLLQNLLHPGNQVECVAISPDGPRLASGGEDKTVRVWDATTGREILGLRGHTDRCGCLAFSPDGHRLASASFDGTIRIWDGTPLRVDEPRQETLTFTEHSDEIRSVAFSSDASDGLRIASTGTDGLVKVWDARTRRVIAEFSRHVEASGSGAAVFCLVWHPKGHHIASVGLDTVRVWDALTKRELFKLPAPLGRIALPYSAVAFSPDGRYLVTGKTGAVQVWDGETGDPVGTLDIHRREVRGLVFSRDGEHLASVSGDGIVKLWDAKRLNEKQQAHRTFRARVPGPAVNVAFSPDGRRLATGGEENTVKIWDVQTGKELRILKGHKGEVYTLAFSPDDGGRWIASAGEDSTVRVWDSHTGKLVRTFRGHRGLVSSLAFSPDAKFLVSGSRDKTVKVWDLTQLSSEVGDR
jgi:WD40 repeat protein/serine/threonine protein kinase